MKKHNTCPRCGSNSQSVGNLQSTGSVHFRPLDTRFLTFLTADISVQASMCPGCGLVTLEGDKQKLQLLKSASGKETPSLTAVK